MGMDQRMTFWKSCFLFNLLLKKGRHETEAARWCQLEFGLGVDLYAFLENAQVFKYN